MPLITEFDPWKNKLCTCLPKYSLSPYTGCSHGCLYCYASSYIKKFNTPRPKKDFIARLKNEIRKIPPRSLIAIANSSDPYLHLENELKLTRRALKIIAASGLKVNIVTKSTLVVRDLDLLQEMRATVSMSLCTLDKELSLRIEPGAPLPQARLEAIAKLSKKINVACRLDPLIPLLNTNDIEHNVSVIAAAGAKQIITSTYKIKPDNFKRMCEAFPELATVWHNLYKKEGEQKNNYVYLPEKERQTLINHVKAASKKYNMYFSSCREGMRELNNSACDGRALFAEAVPPC